MDGVNQMHQKKTNNSLKSHIDAHNKTIKSTTSIEVIKWAETLDDKVKQR